METTIFIDIHGEMQPIDTTQMCIGQSPTRLIICVPGKNGVKESFHQLMHDLETRNLESEVLVVTYSLFGKHGSGGHLDHESIQKQSMVLEKVIQYFRNDSITTVDIIAHSMGSVIASKMASQNVHKIVFLTPMFAMKGIYAWIPLLFFVWLKWLGALFPLALRPYGDAMLNTSCLERRKRIAKTRGQETHSLYDSADALVEASRFLDTERVTHPCLVITAGQDNTVCNQGAEEFCSRYPETRRYLCIPQARHSIHNETTALRMQVVEAICQYLNL